ncbi:uncharacterized protein N0V89_005114 [Didymosphaeria variabile]|uniref:Uncharacterized protein n=1 Tax=Didymosphaeria variabile TaxID=1932322 RepID=A0A9W8XMK2_9PLEO|nr:uncharacterized protein N0V89_005114 [Didymosphaeria variabile]KAJ4353385.1 hypothetical protein N0V89_005114 [Didymosphaeria variabile]
MANTRTNRFSFGSPSRTPSTSLRRLRTAFSPTRSSRSISPSSTGTTSPLARGRDRTGSPDSHRSSGSMNSIRDILMLRHKPSVLDLEMEEEKHLFSHELDVLEPRPSMGECKGAGVGIFEVLDGKF